MKSVFLGIWQNAPVWVWPLFFVLLALGMLSMRDRNSSIVPYFFYPLFGLSAANSIGALLHVPTNWAVFGAAYAIGMAVAFRWQDGLILMKAGRKMRLKGERMTLVILMTVFFSNFVSGVFEAVRPELRGHIAFTVIFATLVGLCSGSFTGRAVRVISLRGR